MGINRQVIQKEPEKWQPEMMLSSKTLIFCDKLVSFHSHSVDI